MLCSHAVLLPIAGRLAPCLAALAGGLPVQGLLGHNTRCSPAAAAAAAGSVAAGQAGSSCSGSSSGSWRGISSGNDFDADDKLGRPTTPWVRQVISGVDLMRHPKYNKGVLL